MRGKVIKKERESMKVGGKETLEKLGERLQIVL
jgi:hypothetical protein